ncbi:MAG: hypothetical protein Q7K39_04525 [Candidatus Magasanikbacteria bacterium]|nr:hypothetical protein [Candidatus Magasanikbacteria bacterium]
MVFSNVTVTLARPTKERLNRLALNYGLSLTEFSQYILEELAVTFPQDSFIDYREPRSLRSSFKRGVKDWRAGRVRTAL